MEFSLDYEYLNAIRLQSGLTNKAIATSQNLSESTISRFFHGELKSPDIAVVRSICDAIGASLDRACGLVRTVDSATTNPAPSIPAVVADVVQSVSEIVDEKKVAEKVAEVIKDSPAIDPVAIAKAVVDAMPERDCDRCRYAQIYEASITRQYKLISALLAAAGSAFLLMAILIVWLLAK